MNKKTALKLKKKYKQKCRQRKINLSEWTLSRTYGVSCSDDIVSKLVSEINESMQKTIETKEVSLINKINLSFCLNSDTTIKHIPLKLDCLINKTLVSTEI